MGSERLIPWLRNQVNVARGAGTLLRLELRHLQPNGKYGNEILTIDGIPERGEEEFFGAIAAQIEGAAESDATVLGGVQTYAVCPFRSKNPDRPAGRFLFRADGGSEFEEDTGNVNSEPANRQGLQAQLMRHLEARDKVMMAAVQGIVATMHRTIVRLTDQNEKQQEQRIQQIEVVEDLLSQRLQRELDQQKEQAKIRMMEEGIKEIKLLAPAVVNRLAGKEILPVAEDSKALALRRFAESLSDDQRAEFAKTLSPSQQIALGELLQAMTPNQEH